MAEAIRLAPITLRGCASGELNAAYCIVISAPRPPLRMVLRGSCVTSVTPVLTITTTSAREGGAAEGEGRLAPRRRRERR